jgi:hypothetical protein
MTFDEFNIWLQKNKGLLFGLGQTAAQSYYKKVVKAIKPHYDGMLPDALNKAFPNEGEGILEYRKEIYKPKTKALVGRAVNNLSRAFSGSKYAVHVESQEFESFLKKFKKKGQGLITYITSVVYSRRVLDPNAYLLVFQNAVQDDNEVPQPQIKVIASSRILYESDTVLIYAPTKKEKATGIHYNIVTTDFYGTVRREEDRYITTVIYEHEIGYLPCTKLGGKPVILTDDDNDDEIEVFESDFTAALPYLDAAVQYDNQFDAVMFSVMFPIPVITGIECISCNGMQQVPCSVEEDKNGYKKCDSCNGSGTLVLSPLKGIMIKKRAGMTTEERIASMQEKVLEFVSAGVESPRLLKETADEALEQARQILNVHQGIKQAQSGIAKEIDRDESVYNQMTTISDYMFNVLIYNTLVAMQDVLINTTSARGAITVNAPTSFGLQTQMKSIEELKGSLTGLPQGLRHKAYFDHVQKYYYGDPTAITIEKYCTQYAPLYIYNDDEKMNGMATGIYTKDDIVKSNFVHSWLLQISSFINIQTADFNRDIKPKLDALLAANKPPTPAMPKM